MLAATIGTVTAVSLLMVRLPPEISLALKPHGRGGSLPLSLLRVCERSPKLLTQNLAEYDDIVTMLTSCDLVLHSLPLRRPLRSRFQRTQGRQYLVAVFAGASEEDC